MNKLEERNVAVEEKREKEKGIKKMVKALLELYYSASLSSLSPHQPSYSL